MYYHGTRRGGVLTRSRYVASPGTVFGACNGKSCRQMVVTGRYVMAEILLRTVAVVGIAYTVGVRMVDVEAAWRC